MSKSQNDLSFEEYLNNPEAIKRDQKQLFSNLKKIKILEIKPI